CEIFLSICTQNASYGRHNFILPSLGKRLPFPAQQTIVRCVRDLIAHDPTLAQESFFLKTKALQSSGRSQVAWINIGFEAIQVQPIKGVLEQGLQSFMHISQAPIASAEGIPNLRATAGC